MWFHIKSTLQLEVEGEGGVTGEEDLSDINPITGSSWAAVPDFILQWYYFKILKLLWKVCGTIKNGYLL